MKLRLYSKSGKVRYYVRIAPLCGSLITSDRTLVPKRITRTRKDDHVRARDEGDDTLLLEKLPNKKRKVSGSQSQTQYPTTSPKSQRNAVKKSMSVSESDSETEPESDQDLLLDKKDEKKDISEVEPPPSPTSQEAPSSLDSDRLPGRIIGMAYPLEDFKTNIASGDLVTKAVEDLAFVIKTIVMKPYSSRRTPEMLQCMQELRKVATEVSTPFDCYSMRIV